MNAENGGTRGSRELANVRKRRKVLTTTKPPPPKKERCHCPSIKNDYGQMCPKTLSPAFIEAGKSCREGTTYATNLLCHLTPKFYFLTLDCKSECSKKTPWWSPTLCQKRGKSVSVSACCEVYNYNPVPAVKSHRRAATVAQSCGLTSAKSKCNALTYNDLLDKGASVPPNSQNRCGHAMFKVACIWSRDACRPTCTTTPATTTPTPVVATTTPTPVVATTTTTICDASANLPHAKEVCDVAKKKSESFLEQNGISLSPSENIINYFISKFRKLKVRANMDGLLPKANLVDVRVEWKSPSFALDDEGVVTASVRAKGEIRNYKNAGKPGKPGATVPLSKGDPAKTTTHSFCDGMFHVEEYLRVFARGHIDALALDGPCKMDEKVRCKIEAQDNWAQGDTTSACKVPPGGANSASAESKPPAAMHRAWDLYAKSIRKGHEGENSMSLYQPNTTDVLWKLYDGAVEQMLEEDSIFKKVIGMARSISGSPNALISLINGNGTEPRLFLDSEALRSAQHAHTAYLSKLSETQMMAQCVHYMAETFTPPWASPSESDAGSDNAPASKVAMVPPRVYIKEQLRERRKLFSGSVRLEFNAGQHRCGGPAFTVPLSLIFEYQSAAQPGEYVRNYMQGDTWPTYLAKKANGNDWETSVRSRPNVVPATADKHNALLFPYYHGGVGKTGITGSENDQLELVQSGSQGGRVCGLSKGSDSVCMVKDGGFNDNCAGADDSKEDCEDASAGTCSEVVGGTNADCDAATTTIGCKNASETGDECIFTAALADACTFFEGSSAASLVNGRQKWDTDWYTGTDSQTKKFVDDSVAVETAMQSWMPFLDEVVRRSSGADGGDENAGARVSTVLATLHKAEEARGQHSVTQRRSWLTANVAERATKIGFVGIMLPPAVSLSSLLCLGLGLSSEDGLNFNVGFDGDKTQCMKFLSETDGWFLPSEFQPGASFSALVGLLDVTLTRPTLQKEFYAKGSTFQLNITDKGYKKLICNTIGFAWINLPFGGNKLMHVRFNCPAEKALGGATRPSVPPRREPGTRAGPARRRQRRTLAMPTLTTAIDLTSLSDCLDQVWSPKNRPEFVNTVVGFIESLIPPSLNIAMVLSTDTVAVEASGGNLPDSPALRGIPAGTMIKKGVTLAASLSVPKPQGCAKGDMLCNFVEEQFGTDASMFLVMAVSPSPLEVSVSVGLGGISVKLDARCDASTNKDLVTLVEASLFVRGAPARPPQKKLMVEAGVRVVIAFEIADPPASDSSTHCALPGMRQSLTIEGELAVEVGGLPRISGQLTMKGIVYRLFGLSMLHVADLGLYLAFTPPSPIPTAFEAAGTLAIGRECYTQNAGTLEVIKNDASDATCLTGTVAVGYDSNDPKANYVAASINGLNIMTLIKLFAPADKVETVLGVLPGAVKESGFVGETSFSVTADPAGAVDVMERHIPGGMRAKGAFNLLGWKAAAEMIVVPGTSIFLHAVMDPISILGVFEVKSAQMEGGCFPKAPPVSEARHTAAATFCKILGENNKCEEGYMPEKPAGKPLQPGGTLFGVDFTGRLWKSVEKMANGKTVHVWKAHSTPGTPFKALPVRPLTHRAHVRRVCGMCAACVRSLSCVCVCVAAFTQRARVA